MGSINIFNCSKPKSSININDFSKKIFGMLGIKPWATGSEALMLPLRYAAPLIKFFFTPKNRPKKIAQNIDNFAKFVSLCLNVFSITLFFFSPNPLFSLLSPRIFIVFTFFVLHSYRARAVLQPLQKKVFFGRTRGCQVNNKLFI